MGKGVCFDSGGLDLKPASGMLLMKKDMGGAAHAMALAQTIMDAELHVRLRLLIPAVENSVAGNALRPLDVIDTRKKLRVEVGNTDAEGRLILSDALAAACEDEPELIIDFATLTGAARVALGYELPALFSNDTVWAERILRSGEAAGDMLWRLPLHSPYERYLKSTVADLNNIGSVSVGGAITAALFLQRFVDPRPAWVHVDQMAWNIENRPGRPKGGEAMGLRAIYGALHERYAKKPKKAKTKKAKTKKSKNGSQEDVQAEEAHAKAKCATPKHAQANQAAQRSAQNEEIQSQEHSQEKPSQQELNPQDKVNKSTTAQFTMGSSSWAVHHGDGFRAELNYVTIRWSL